MADSEKLREYKKRCGLLFPGPLTIISLTGGTWDIWSMI